MYYVIYGDIHGCLEEWEELRSLVPKNSFEICVGDILDKGPFPLESLRYAKKNRILSIMGNHEFKHLRKYWGRNVQLDYDQQKIYPKLTKNDFEFISSFPFYIKINLLTVVHAGMSKCNLSTLDKKTITSLLYVREVDENGEYLKLNHSCKKAKFWSEIYSGKEGFVIYGHTPFKKPFFKNSSLGIDTGCVYGNKLTAVIIKDTLKPWDYEIVEVQAKKEYLKRHTPLK